MTLQMPNGLVKVLCKCAGTIKGPIPASVEIHQGLFNKGSRSFGLVNLNHNKLE